MVRTSLLLLCGVALHGTLAAQSTPEWSPRERMVVGDYTRITAVAAAQDRVYAASPDGILIWNPYFRQWEGTATPPDPAMLDRVFAGLVDPLDNTLWLARLDGWVHYNPFIQTWERGTVGGAVQGIAFDLGAPLDGLYLRTGGGWMTVPRGSSGAVPASAPRRPLAPPTVREAIEQNPTLQANSSAILQDNRLRSARFTSAARSFDGLGWYIGTWGAGLLYLPDGAALPQQLTYGLPGRAVDALFGAPDGVWVTTARGANQDPAIAFVSSDLSDFRWIRGPTGFGLPFDRSSAMVARGRELWIGTNAGAVRVDMERGGTTVYDEGRGLPDSRVLSLATRYGRLVIGTARGVVTVDSGEVQRVAPGWIGASQALAITGDTIWVGTRAGIRVILPGESDARILPQLESAASLQLNITGFAWQGDTLVALSDDRLLWRKPSSGTWFLGPVLSPLLGRLRAITADRQGLWVAGDRAVAFTTPTMSPTRPLDIPADTNGDVMALAADDVYLWIGTERGLTRFAMQAIRP